MKYLFLMLFSLGASADLDLTIPEQPVVQIPETKFLQFNYYREPPTRAQMITFWTLNALDVITTYEALKALPNGYEKNPLYSDRPSLGQLVAGKIIIGSLVGNNMSKTPMRFFNAQLSFVVYHNYSLYN
tara:strand:+ start:3177 stop:3563 length:387 start_codon:yes stop_codon:yes gene_type:complete